MRPAANFADWPCGSAPDCFALPFRVLLKCRRDRQDPISVIRRELADCVDRIISTGNSSSRLGGYGIELAKVADSAQNSRSDVPDNSFFVKQEARTALPFQRVKRYVDLRFRQCQFWRNPEKQRLTGDGIRAVVLDSVNR